MEEGSEICPPGVGWECVTIQATMETTQAP